MKYVWTEQYGDFHGKKDKIPLNLELPSLDKTTFNVVE